MEKQSEEVGAIRIRIQLIKSLKIAIKEADKLNSILDDLHNMLHANAAKKAA